MRSVATRSSGSTDRLSHRARGRSSRTGTRVLHVLYRGQSSCLLAQYYLLDDSDTVTWLQKLLLVVLGHIAVDDDWARVVGYIYW